MEIEVRAPENVRPRSTRTQTAVVRYQSSGQIEGLAVKQSEDRLYIVQLKREAKSSTITGLTTIKTKHAICRITVIISSQLYFRKLIQNDGDET